MKTKAAVLYKLNSPLVIKEIEIPLLKKGQVLVKILASGICRSQLNEIKGLKGEDRYLPHLLGHEGAGVVEDIGPKVKKVKKGDYVVLSWIKGEGLEAPVPQYLTDEGIVNSGAVATFSEYSVVSENRLVKIPRSLPPHLAALLGCALPTGGGAVIHDFALSQRTSMAVFGVGGVGAGAILVAKMKNCGRIVAVDITQEKLAFARKLGATETIFFRDCQNLTVDFALEASGVKTVMEKAFESIKNTGILVIAGNLQKGEKISINPFELMLGKKIIGSWGGETKPDNDIPFYARAYLKGKLKLDKLITQKIKLEEINKAFEQMEMNKILGRIIIEF